jgi:hypothetical protein
MHEVVLCILLPELSKIGEISSGPMLKMLPWYQFIKFKFISVQKFHK